MDGWLSSLDAWKTRADDDAPDREPPPRRVSYHCLDCAWAGKEAYAHHRDSHHHRIVIRNAEHLGPQLFGCCHELSRR